MYFFSPYFILTARGGLEGGSDGGGAGLVSEPHLAAPPSDHAGAAGPLRDEGEIVITVTVASDDELEDVGRRVHDSFRIECRFDPEASEMSARIAAISRSRAASRECTPTHSRAVSRVPSSEELNEGRVIINPVQEALHSHPLSTSQNPSRRPSQSDPSHRWGGSSSNLTSTDSTPSSDIADSGQATDSPLTGNINALGFPSTAEDASPCQYRMPIVGYEVLEERARFTVFKIQVFHQPTEEHWFVFRRYTDFVRLNKALKKEFPRLRFALPPKRWFGDNFDPIFLEDRQLGLQAFIDNVVGHTVIREKKCVRDFFCLDDPLGTQDTLAESRVGASLENKKK
ncbi:sorting nexin-16-like isoform X3 [Eriocheir sinensis]|uniref:sorting nexin-16-like isoform X3 n=1 Tax=Eriocheir sinensis TaxID=95602 RepID=UPI0021C7BF85|nr:sorting nexin-16-like isoform X3 [Eriocheir sinensis]